MEEAYASGKVRSLGVCNVHNVESLASLWHQTRVKPVFVQNGFWRRGGYDGALRSYCAAANITYQAYRLHTTATEAGDAAEPLHALAPALRSNSLSLTHTHPSQMLTLPDVDTPSSCACTNPYITPYITPLYHPLYHRH